jgi:2-dehydro-3-deoxyphosphooctonate aldolase (KDO 8-P synthase)
MRTARIRVADGVEVGGGAPLLLIAGPDVVESDDHALRMAEALAVIARDRGVSLVYKSSFDKANRSSVASFRGPGLDVGLHALARVKDAVGVPVTTDFHVPDQAATVAEVADLLQVPAFLSRQTDMLVAAGRTGRAINVKRGQFVAPHDAGPIVEKVRSTGNHAVMLTERGASFGYNNLVVDFRGLPRMRALGVPVCFDATHSVQLPGGMGSRSGGEREFVGHLARAAAGVGVDAVFFEVHDDPDRAPCDGPNMVSLEAFPDVLDAVLAVDRARRDAGIP